MDTNEYRSLLEAVQNDRPNYSVQVIKRNAFNEGEVQIKSIKARKEGRKFIMPGWIFIGYADDLLRRYGIRQ